MEHAVSMMNWCSLNGTVPVEESEVMAQLLCPYSFTDEQHHDPILGVPSMFWSDHEVDSYCNSSSYYWPQVCSGTNTSNFFSPVESGIYNLGDSMETPVISPSSEQMEQIIPSHQFGDPNYFNEEVSGDGLGVSSDATSLCGQTSLPKRKLHTDTDDKPVSTNKEGIPTGSPNKRSTKNARSKRVCKTTEDSNEEESNAALNGLSSSCSCPVIDSNVCQENGDGSSSSSSNGSPAMNLNGKTRAGRGSATAPQSLYARKRRQRINGRLRVLQNLVPNGTKAKVRNLELWRIANIIQSVNMRTMLAEAVHYVKFLQLQIKLLSLDDLWMYALIAYNGMDIGIDGKISHHYNEN